MVRAPRERPHDEDDHQAPTPYTRTRSAVVICQLSNDSATVFLASLATSSQPYVPWSSSRVPPRDSAETHERERPADREPPATPALASSAIEGSPGTVSTFTGLSTGAHDGTDVVDRAERRGVQHVGPRLQ